MNPVETTDILNALISNSVRYLDRGLHGFQVGELGFAITDTFFGIEIILKALVFDGRWEFIFDEPGEADLARLKAGNCRTIGLEQAEKRLATLISKPLPRSCAHFKTLRNHRNKLVHFFHPGLVKDKEKVLIARDLANAWGALREIRALPQFESVFRDHSPAFFALDGRLLILDTYLAEEAIRIHGKHLNPEVFEKCPACKQRTLDQECALCGYNEPTHKELTQGAEPIAPADCPKCGAGEAVMPSGERSRCTECGHVFEGIATCEYCGTSFVSIPDGDTESDAGSFYYGCVNCTGRLGDLMDRDD